MRIPASDIQSCNVYIRINIGTSAAPDLRRVSIGQVRYGADIGEILTVVDAIAPVLVSGVWEVRMDPSFILFWEEV